MKLSKTCYHFCFTLKSSAYEERQKRLREQWKNERGRDVPSMKQQLDDAGFGPGGVM